MHFQHHVLREGVYMKSFRKNGKEKPIIIGDNIKRKRHGFFRFPKNFKFPDLSDNPKVQFMNKFSLLFHGLLACILVFTIECVSRHSVTSAVSFCISSPLTFLYNALLIFATLLIVYLFKHRALVRIVISIFWMLLGVINGCVLASRVTPFNFADLKLIGDLLSMKNSKYLSAGQEIAVVILLIALATFLILFAFKGPKFKGRVHLFRNLGLLVLCVASIPFITKAAIHSDILSGYFGNLAQGYKDYGFVYSFSASVVDTGMSKPANYTEETIDTINDNVTTEPTTVDSSDMPNIIFMQLETFIDPYELNFLSYSEDPIPNFHKLMENYTTGYLTVPVVGAGTANTEFEVLTGMSCRFFGPGEYPQKTILKKTDCESFAGDLRNLGYSSHVVHNNGGNFYSRANAFSMMGFDTFQSKEMLDITDYTPLGSWPTDDILTPATTEAMDSTEGPDFVYTITVEAHGDYPTYKVIENPAIGVTCEGKTQEQTYAWEYYINQIHNVDEFIQSYIEELSKRDEDTLVIMFGDHLPTMGLTESEVATGDLFQTKYFTWNNFGMSKEDQDLTSYQLVSEYLNRLGIHEGTMTNYHQSKIAAGVKAGTPEYMTDLEALQYDILYGKRYAYNGEDKYPATDLEMGVSDVVIDRAYFFDGKLHIYGSNFTKWSKVYVNGEKVTTNYESGQCLTIKASAVQNGDTITVCQVGSSNTIFRESNEFTVVDPNYVSDTPGSAEQPDEDDLEADDESSQN